MRIIRHAVICLLPIFALGCGQSWNFSFTNEEPPAKTRAADSGGIQEKSSGSGQAAGGSSTLDNKTAMAARLAFATAAERRLIESEQGAKVSLPHANHQTAALSPFANPDSQAVAPFDQQNDRAALFYPTPEPESEVAEISEEQPLNQKDIDRRPAPAIDQAATKAEVIKELEQLGEKELAAEEMKTDPIELAKAKPSHDLPITINGQVLRYIKYFQTRVPKRFRIWLERSGRYTPMMRRILKQYGLPEDLVYLAMIESGFSCRAYSRAHAVGPWQFMRGIGRSYGLKIGYWVDERRDPIKSTHAAAKFLKDLYAEFGSWYLAAAGYNAGETKIQRALRRYKANDFWSISTGKRRYLKRETREYVPKMIAAAIIAKSPEKYGFKNLKYQEPLAYEIIEVHPGTSVSMAAKAAGLKTSQLRLYNPELRRWSTPPTGGLYQLKLPIGKKQVFQAAYAKLSPEQRRARIGSIKLRVQPGDTLGGIARSFGVSLADLKAMNPKLRPTRLRIGQVVYVPPSKYSRKAKTRKVRLAKVRTSKKTYRAPHRGKRRIVHKVNSGDTLWDIAQRYGVSHRSIKRWNGKRSSRLSVGQKLVLYVPQAKAEAKVEPKAERSKPVKVKRTTYKVRRGDSLWLIAKRFKVSPAQIKKWNRLRSNRINPGDVLKIRRQDNS
jgi:membrane-bound lytic murein transglycosylase D